jgi:hypothetical protein
MVTCDLVRDSNAIPSCYTTKVFTAIQSCLIYTDGTFYKMPSMIRNLGFWVLKPCSLIHDVSEEHITYIFMVEFCQTRDSANFGSGVKKLYTNAAVVKWSGKTRAGESRQGP